MGNAAAITLCSFDMSRQSDELGLSEIGRLALAGLVKSCDRQDYVISLGSGLKLLFVQVTHIILKSKKPLIHPTKSQSTSITGKNLPVDRSHPMPQYICHILNSD